MAPINTTLFGPQNVAINVRISENHRLESDITQQPLETGAPITDHVILRPRTVTLIYEQTNAADGLGLAQLAWNTCLGYWTARTPLFVVTQHCTYMNMIIESLTGLHQAPMKGALTFTMQLKQINFANLQYVTVPASQLAGNTPPPATPAQQMAANFIAARQGLPPVYQTASTPIQGGQQQAQTVTQNSTGGLDFVDMFDLVGEMP